MPNQQPGRWSESGQDGVCLAKERQEAEEDRRRQAPALLSRAHAPTGGKWSDSVEQFQVEA